MTAAWPLMIPLRALAAGYGEQAERNVAEFTPEIGPPKTRRRTSISSDVLSFATHMAPAQYDLLLAFYRDTLADGTLSFTRQPPRDPEAAEQEYMFTEAPKFRAVHARLGEVTLALRRLP